jgi:hypothetical protein
MVAAVAAISVAVTYANGALGDYPVDAGPTIDAHGHVRQALASHPIMGALAVLIRVPFAALAKVLGGGEVAIHRAGCFPCVLALGLLGPAFVGGAVLLALRRRSIACGIALGLALATKQWAAIAETPATPDDGCKSSLAGVLGRPHPAWVCGLPASWASSIFAAAGITGIP